MQPTFEMSDGSVTSKQDTLLDVAGRPAIEFPEPPELSSHGPARIIAMVNQKGGVGKTTTAVNIGAALAMGGLRVLVIDLDPQGNACTALGIDRTNLEGMFEVLVNDAPLSKVVKKAAGFAHLECAPADMALAGAEVNMVSFVSRESRLKFALEKFLQEREAAGQRIDYVIIEIGRAHV